MSGVSTAETMALLKAALSAQNSRPDLAKGFTQSNSATTGLTAYSLEAPAKTLYPVITPLRNMIPRVTATSSGIQANWRAITAINTTKVPSGLAEGHRGGVLSTTVKEYLAAFRGLGLDDHVTFEAELAGQGFDDVKARAVEGLLRSLMIEEEGIILGGFGSGTTLGTTPTPTVTVANGGGSFLANTAYSVICVALSPRGLAASNRSDLTVGITPAITVTRADGSTMTVNGGCAAKSTAGTATTANDSTNTKTLSASVAAVRGAAGYAWFVGTSGNEKLAAITTINSVYLTAPPAGGNEAVPAAVSSDVSDDSYVFDGLLGMVAKSANGSYWKAMATGTAGTGTGLTGDGAGGIQEFDEALQWFWDNYKLSPTNIWVSSQEMNYIRKKILTGGSNAVHRFAISAPQQAVLGGFMIAAYTNPFSMGGAKTIPIEMHPNLPAGTVLFTTSALPYTLSGVTDVMRVLCRRDYYQIEWPLLRRRYEYGVYTDEVLQHYFPPSLGCITNIAPS